MTTQTRRRTLDTQSGYVYTVRMAYLRRYRAPNGTIYLYIMRSVRKGEKVTPKVCEYLGREDQIDQKRLKKALTYWGVKAKPGKGGKRARN